MSTIEQVEVSEKYQPYTEYEDSGEEWLGKVPAHWKIKKMAWCFKAQKGRNAQMLTKEFCGENLGDYPVYSGQTENDGVMGNINAYEFDAGEDGYLFATTVGAKAMTLSLLKGKFSLSQNCMVIIPLTNLFITAYSFYHCQPLFAYERGLIPEHMQASFRMEDLYQYRIMMPPHSEQQTIVAFLDYETARIDRLIAQQHRLIELLKEKRQAVVSHAVTKGLNPDAPMKESGVDWLGQVPEHWDILKGAWLGRLFGSDAIADADVVSEGNIAFVKVSTLSSNDLQPNRPEWFVSNQAADGVRAKRNFIAFPKRGAAIFTNKVNIIPYRSVIDPNLMGWEVKDTINIIYLAYCLKTRRLNDIADVSTVPQINNKHISPQRFPLPPRTEQDEIVVRVEQEMVLFDNLVAKAGDAIKLMRERRTALISAAVTGKIDLRRWAQPSEVAA